MKWEYKVIFSDTLHRFFSTDCQNMLTDEGQNEWELVTVRPAPALSGEDCFIFKRMVLVELRSDFTVHVGENVTTLQPLVDAMRAGA